MNLAAYVSNKRYVYFDENGNITSIGSFSEALGNYIEVDLSEVEDLLSGKEQVHNYNVLFDEIDKKYLLKKKKVQDYFSFNINNLLYKIPKEKVLKPDITVIQNNNNKHWEVRLRTELRNYLKDQDLIYDPPLNFSITSVNDPNVLYQTFDVDFKSLVHSETLCIPFSDQLLKNKKNFSIYTKKKYENYLHEVKE